MNKKGNSSIMFISTVIMGILAVVLLLVAYYKGVHMTGLNQAMRMTMQILPLLIFAFIVAGMAQALLPHETISRWIGEESGMKGVLIGTVAGAMTPGGPYLSLPIVAGLLKSGASIGVMVAYIAGWSLLNISRLPMEIGILGWRFTLVRFLSVLILPPIAGAFAHYISKVLR